MHAFNKSPVANGPFEEGNPMRSGLCSEIKASLIIKQIILIYLKWLLMNYDKVILLLPIISDA